MGARGEPGRGFQTNTPPLEASLPKVPLCTPSFRRIKHRTNLRKLHMTVMWLWGAEEKTGWSPAHPCSSTWADQGIGPAFRAVAGWGPRALRGHLGRGGGVIGGVNFLNALPVPVPVPFVHHHFPLPLFLNPPPRLVCIPPPAPGSSPSLSSPASLSSFSSSPSFPFSAYPRSLRLTPQLAVVRREEEEELALVQLLLLQLLLLQVLLPVAAPLAPSKRVRGQKKFNFCAPEVIS